MELHGQRLWRPENRAAGGLQASSHREKAQHGEMLWKAPLAKDRGWMKTYLVSVSREGINILLVSFPLGGQKVKVWSAGGLRYVKWAGSGCHVPCTQRNRSAQTDGSSTWRWYLLSCCPPLTLEEEPGAGCSWQLPASLSLPPSIEKIGAGIVGKTLNATAAPFLQGQVS